MTIQAAFKGVITAVIADPTLSRGDAGAIVEAYGPEMRGSEARAWIDGIAGLYESIGVINNPTWGNLRNEIANEGQTVAENLFNAMEQGVRDLPATFVVEQAITRETARQQLAEVNTSIATIEGFKTGQTQQVIDALDQGILALNTLKRTLESALGA